jgi:hypothetical protein
LTSELVEISADAVFEERQGFRFVDGDQVFEEVRIFQTPGGQDASARPVFACGQEPRDMGVVHEGQIAGQGENRPAEFSEGRHDPPGRTDAFGFVDDDGPSVRSALRVAA